MKNKSFSSKDFIVLAIILAVISVFQVVLVSIHNATLTEIEKGNSSLVLLKDELQAKTVVKQKYEAEDRIVKIVSDSLGLVRSDNPYDILRINKNEINRIKKVVLEKYDW